MQKKLLLTFLLFILFYHILHTFIVYGQGWLSVGEFSSLKELFFLLLLGWGSWTSRSYLKFLFQSFKSLWIMIIMIFGVFLGVSRWHHIPLDILLVGVKYDLWWIVILMGGVVLGIQNSKFKIQKYIFMMLRIVILGGIAWQTGKVLFPDLFLWRGYGSIGDYVLGSHPPMWYRTGPGGWMRFSGIFSGPNNLGYLMVAFFPVVIVPWSLRVEGNGMKQSIHRLLRTSQGPRLLGRNLEIIKNLALPFAMILTTIATLSRGAMGAMFLEILILLYYYKKERRSYLSLVLVGGIGAGIGLLLFKRGSTLEHLARFLEGFQVTLQHPRGMGLGMAGPSIHYKGVYLPENQFLQRAIDGGFIGMFSIIVLIFIIGKYVLSQTTNFKFQTSSLFFLGFLGLLIEGMLLHTFEDSMVNYLFFLSFGLVFGTSLLVKGKPGDGVAAH